MSASWMVTRAVAVASGAMLAGAAGAGAAAAATGVPDPGSLAGSAVSGTLSTVTNTVSSTGSTAGLPKPVQQAVKKVSGTVKSVEQTVAETLQTLTSGGGSNKPSGNRQPGTGAGQRQDHQGALSPARNRHHSHQSGGHSGSAPVLSGTQVAGLTHLGLSAGQAPAIPTGQAPAVAPAPTHPEAAGSMLSRLGHDLANPLGAFEGVPGDSTLQLELTLLAAALAGIVAGGHVLVAKRRLLATATTLTPRPAPATLTPRPTLAAAAATATPRPTPAVARPVTTGGTQPPARPALA